MKIAALNWMQVERYLERDDRAVVPLGSTEQHAYLSLATDSILAERVAAEAAGERAATAQHSTAPRARVTLAPTPPRWRLGHSG